MSLKAKLEAVIYAAEEPVTLPQMLALFAAEALEARAARMGQEPAALLRFEFEPAAEPANAEDSAAAEPANAAEASPEPASEASAESESRLTRLRERQARDELRLLLEQLRAEYAPEERGLELREVGGGWRFATKPLYHDAVRGLIRTLKPPLKLSLPALETLAVIAYKQPVTAPEIGDVRGVDSGGVLGSLIARKLVTTAGRKAVIGRPILYKTTREFLLRFGLKDLGELPSMEEFERMAAAELSEGEGEEPAMDGAQNQPTTNEATHEATHELESGATPNAAPGAAEQVQAAPEQAQGADEAEVAARAEAEISVGEEDSEAAEAADLPGVTRDLHGQLPIQSSPAALIRRPAEEDEAV